MKIKREAGKPTFSHSKKLIYLIHAMNMEVKK